MCIDLVQTNDARFSDLMSHLEGMITLPEAIFLRDAASQAPDGAIVEIGSWRGKSAVALAAGVAARPESRRAPVYCIEPHRRFTGAYGGKFGPQDRTAFYKTMLAVGASELVALVNLPSEEVAPGWRSPIGMLFIDGDHAYDGVKRDFDLWEKFLVVGARVIFDDISDRDGGPNRLVTELVESGNYRVCRAVGKMAAISR